MAGDGLRLSSVASLFEKANNGNEFERLLNTTGINNLDLDEDGHIDDIDVVEYGSGSNRGFSLTVDMGSGHVQQVAEITLRMGGDGWVHYAIRGNPQLYPRGSYFEARLQPTALAFVAWAFMPNRVVYVPSYRYDPTIVRERRVVLSPRVYEERTVVIEKTTKVVVKKATPAPVDPILKSPNEGKASAIVKAPLANPTETQKQFQATNPSETTLTKGGFGKQKDKVVAPSTETVSPVGKTPEKESLADPQATQKQFQETDPTKNLGAKGFGTQPATPVPVQPATPPGVTAPRVIATPGGIIPPAAPATVDDAAAAAKRKAELDEAKKAAAARKAADLEAAKKSAAVKKK